MKNLPVLFLAVLLCTSCGVFHTASPPVGANKLNVIQSWKEDSVTLVLAGSSNPPVKGKTMQVPAKRAVFQSLPYPKWPRSDFSLLLIPDPKTKKQFLVDGDHSFYVSVQSKLIGVTVFGGALIWSTNYLAAPASERPDTVIERFERRNAAARISDSWLMRGTDNRISLPFPFVPMHYFSDAPSPGGLLVTPKIDNVEVLDGVLHLDLHNPSTKKPASFWIDLGRKKVIRSVVDGEEMDISRAEAFWAAVTQGELYERHTFPGKPIVEIQIYGFTDSAFDAYLRENETRKKIMVSLACMKEYVGYSTNSIFRKYEGTCSTTTSALLANMKRPQMFEVFWSLNGNRVGIAFSGYLVAGYDRVSGTTVELKQYQSSSPSQHYEYQACDAAIAKFLAEDSPAR